MKLKWELRKKKLKIIIYFVLIKTFNFLGQIVESIQVLFHSYLHFLDYFCHVLHYCRFNWTTLMDTYLRFLQKNSFVVPYWHVLENAWLGHVPWKLSSKPKISQLIKLYCYCHCIQVYPPLKKKATIFFLYPYSSHNVIKFLTKTCLVMSLVSNKPIVICFGCQWSFKKFIIKTKMSCSPFDIHKPKLMIK